MSDSKQQTTHQVTWDHVHIRTHDVKATAQWFADILGGEILGVPDRIHVRLAGQLIFLAPVTEGDGVNPPPVTPYRGLDHIGLATKDIDDVAASLKAKGVKFTKEPFTLKAGLRVCFIETPEGVSIEILERDPKYT